jgi:hypothetical protein
MYSRTAIDSSLAELVFGSLGAGNETGIPTNVPLCGNTNKSFSIE